MATGQSYRVVVFSSGAPYALKRLISGITVDGQRLAPCKISTLKDVDNPWLSITLIEGKNNQIRKMFDRIGHSVVKLKRVQIGFLRDPHLKPGDFRRLAPEEVKRFKALRPAPLVASSPRRNVTPANSKPGRESSRIN